MNQNEPIFNAAVITAGVAVLIDLALAYGVDITDAQQASWRALAAFLAPFIVWVASRRKTVTVDKANDAVSTAASGGPVETFQVGQ